MNMTQERKRRLLRLINRGTIAVNDFYEIGVVSEKLQQAMKLLNEVRAAIEAHDYLEDKKLDRLMNTPDPTEQELVAILAGKEIDG